MTTELAYNLFLDEHDAILDTELFNHIDKVIQSNYNLPLRISVVEDDDKVNKMNFRKSKKDEFLKNRKKMNFEIYENEIVLESKNIKSKKDEFLKKGIRNEMIIGYMNLLSN